MPPRTARSGCGNSLAIERSPALAAATELGCARSSPTVTWALPRCTTALTPSPSPEAGRGWPEPARARR
jgi:hypothetical protein